MQDPHSMRVAFVARAHLPARIGQPRRGRLRIDDNDTADTAPIKVRWTDVLSRRRKSK